MALRERDIKDHLIVVRGDEQLTSRVLYETLNTFAAQQDKRFTLDDLASLLAVKPSTIQYRIAEIRKLIEIEEGWNNAQLLQTIDNGRIRARFFVYSDPNQEVALMGRAPWLK